RGTPTRGGAPGAGSVRTKSSRRLQPGGWTRPPILTTHSGHDTVSSGMDTLPGFDLNALARFAAVAEHGGFSPAARALGLPRKSIHRSVAQFEEAAGVRLLDRGE